MDLKVINHLSNLPIVKSGINLATNAYFKVKECNRLVSWSLETAEASIVVAVDLSRPTILHFSGPIHLLDEMLDKSLEIVEDMFPLVKSPPQQIVSATKGYMYSVVEPVLKTVDSVKECTIECSEMAAQTVDNALTIADIYVDKYLPEMSKHIIISGQVEPLSCSQMDSQTKRTIQHISKFSRTLRRRLSQRALYEMVQFKNAAINLFHTLLRLVDLLIKDQEMFVRKVRQVWNELSEDEPENQVAPQNVEQLIRLLTKEACRRFVHLTNSMVMHLINVPKYGEYYWNYSLNQLSQYVEGLNINEEGALHHIEVVKRTMDIIIDRFFEILFMELSIKSDTIPAVVNSVVQDEIELHQVNQVIIKEVESTEIEIKQEDEDGDEEEEEDDHNYPHHHHHHHQHHHHGKRGHSHSKGKHGSKHHMHKTPERTSARSHSKDTPSKRNDNN